MEAGVAVVAVEYLIAFVIRAAEAYLAVRLELAVVLVLALIRRRAMRLPIFALLVNLVRLEDLVSLVCVSLSKVFENVRPN